jgi:hypothetical protein
MAHCPGLFLPGWVELGPDQVFFEVTKQEKVNRIVTLGCSHYIDDLPEILEMLPDPVQPILFAPAGRWRCQSVGTSSTTGAICPNFCPPSNT